MNTEKIENVRTLAISKTWQKVLRPGGVTLTQKMLSMLNITSNDDVVEFAPGLGFTAQMSINRKPKSYIGIDADKNSVNYLSKKFEKVMLYLDWVMQHKAFCLNSLLIRYMEKPC